MIKKDSLFEAEIFITGERVLTERSGKYMTRHSSRNICRSICICPVDDQNHFIDKTAAVKGREIDPMKVIMIHGQNHKGTTYHMGHILADQLAGVEDITEFFLPRDMNHFCLGCYACIEDETKCPYWSEKKKILDAMEKADLFIFTTPNYCLAPSGAMKSMLDVFFDLWMVHRPKVWMFQKRAVVLSAAAGASCKKALGTVKDSLFYWGVPWVKTYGLALHAANWNEVTSKDKSKVERDLAKIAGSIDTEKSPHVSIKTKFIFNIMKMTHEKGWDSSPVEKQYWQERGWLERERPWKRQ